MNVIEKAQQRMTDYTKLVKELRGCKDMDYCTDCPRMANGYVGFCNIKDDAADAIEHLLHERNEARETASYWMKQTEYANAQLKMHSMCPFDDEEEEE